MPATGRTIVFLSDFGYRNEWVGICHAVMNRIAPASPVVDLSHGIPPLDVDGDRRSHELLARRIAEERPDDAVLSEEGERAVEGRGRTWVVDPLDGTREFGEPGREDWAVHVALVVDERAGVGAVALPARGVVLSTGAPPAQPPPERRPPRVVVSRTRPPAFAEAFAEALGGELVALGSAGAKTAAVVLGEADVYVHAGGQHAWDTAAPVAVALAAGAHVSRVDGSPVRFDCADPWTPDVLVCL